MKQFVAQKLRFFKIKQAVQFLVTWCLELGCFAAAHTVFEITCATTHVVWLQNQFSYLQFQSYISADLRYSVYSVLLAELQSGAHKRCNALLGSGITQQHQTRLERHSRDKYATLVRTFENYDCYFFITQGPKPNVIKHFLQP